MLPEGHKPSQRSSDFALKRSARRERLGNYVGSLTEKNEELVFIERVH
jgi:hypothetical protein